MKGTRFLSPVIGAFLFLLGVSVQGAVLELKSGERLEGTFKQASVDGGIVIEVGGQAITMPFAKVRAIYFGAAPTATPTVSAEIGRAHV